MQSNIGFVKSVRTVLFDHDLPDRPAYRPGPKVKRAMKRAERHTSRAQLLRDYRN